jgi:hypothetical protein
METASASIGNSVFCIEDGPNGMEKDAEKGYRVRNSDNGFRLRKNRKCTRKGVRSAKNQQN